MAKEVKLVSTMTESEFDNGYWYSDELKQFAKEIGIRPAAKLRKDELEKCIKHFLRTGEVKNLTQRNLTKRGVKDIDKGLSLQLPIANYTSKEETQEFIKKEANKLEPNLKEKSGVWYRLNRWREEQITTGREVTYEDLMKEYVRLNQSEESFARIEHARYINFVADFLAGEKNGTREKATQAWQALKTMELPKTYQAWKRHQK